MSNRGVVGYLTLEGLYRTGNVEPVADNDRFSLAWENAKRSASCYLNVEGVQGTLVFAGKERVEVARRYSLVPPLGVHSAIQSAPYLLSRSDSDLSNYN